MMQVKVRKNRTWMALLMLMLLVVLAACSVGLPATTDAPAATQATAVLEEPTVAVEATEAPADEIASADATAVPDEEAGGEATQDVVEESAAGTAGTTTFVINADQSEVRFILTEVLMGTDTTVVGSGNGIEGEVTVNFDDYSQSTISPIVIDASLLATDNNMRNGQIRRAILQTNNPDYQFITFTPTSVEGLPERTSVGEPFDLTVTGDLTIRTNSSPMTFEVSVTPVSETELHGSARATLLRSDFDLQIPSVPSVANVSEEVLLEFDFVALAQ